MSYKFQKVKYSSREDFITALVLYCVKENIAIRNYGIDRNPAFGKQTPTELHLKIEQNPKQYARILEERSETIAHKIEIFESALQDLLELRKVEFLRRVIDRDSINSEYFRKGHHAKTIKELETLRREFSDYLNPELAKSKMKESAMKLKDSVIIKKRKKDDPLRYIRAREEKKRNKENNINPRDFLY